MKNKEWKYFRDNLELLNDMERKEGSQFVTEILKFLMDSIQPERSKREDRNVGGYFPPPWNMIEHPEKTDGWISFQEELRKDPQYYGCGALNIEETQ